MKLRLLLRRLTVSAPRMAVRSALPWPFRWAMLAIVAGFCAAIGLWAFEFGKDIAGLDKGTKEQLQQALAQVDSLRAELAQVTQERNKAQAVADTADTVLTTEKVAQEKLLAQNRQLEADNQRLKDDLGFFEQLIPAPVGGQGAGMLAIRGLHAERLPTGELRWQVLVIQAARRPAAFSGQLEVTFAGVLQGKPWSTGLPAGAQSIDVGQYARLSGVLQVPVQAEVRNITAKVLSGKSTLAMQTTRL